MGRFDTALDHLFASLGLFDEEDPLSIGLRRNVVLDTARILSANKNDPQRAVEVVESHLRLDPFALQDCEEMGSLLEQAYTECKEVKKATEVQRRVAKARTPFGIGGAVDGRKPKAEGRAALQKGISIVPIAIALIVIGITIWHWVVR